MLWLVYKAWPTYRILCGIVKGQLRSYEGIRMWPLICDFP